MVFGKDEFEYTITNSGLFLTAYKNPTVTPIDRSTWSLHRLSSPQDSPPVYSITASHPVYEPEAKARVYVPANLEPVFEPAPSGAQPAQKGAVRTDIGEPDAGWTITPDALERGSIVTLSKFPEGVKFPDGISVYLVQESGKVGWVAADNTVLGKVPEGAVWKFQKIGDLKREPGNEDFDYKITSSELFLTATKNPTVTSTDRSSWSVQRLTSPLDSPPVLSIRANKPIFESEGTANVNISVSLEPVFEPAPHVAQPEKGAVKIDVGDSVAGWRITPDALHRGYIVTVSKFPEGVKFPDGISVYLVQECGKVGWVAADKTDAGRVPEGAVWKFQKADK